MDRKLKGSTLLETLVAIIVITLSITLSTMFFLLLLGKPDSKPFYLDQLEVYGAEIQTMDESRFVKKEIKLQNGSVVYDYERIEGRNDIIKVSVKSLDSQGRINGCINRIVNL